MFEGSFWLRIEAQLTKGFSCTVLSAPMHRLASPSASHKGRTRKCCVNGSLGVLLNRRRPFFSVVERSKVCRWKEVVLHVESGERSSLVKDRRWEGGVRHCCCKMDLRQEDK